MLVAVASFSAIPPPGPTPVGLSLCWFRAVSSANCMVVLGINIWSLSPMSFSLDSSPSISFPFRCNALAHRTTYSHLTRGSTSDNMDERLAIAKANGGNDGTILMITSQSHLLICYVQVPSLMNRLSTPPPHAQLQRSAQAPSNRRRTVSRSMTDRTLPEHPPTERVC